FLRVPDKLPILDAYRDRLSCGSRGLVDAPAVTPSGGTGHEELRASRRQHGIPTVPLSEPAVTHLVPIHPGTSLRAITFIKAVTATVWGTEKLSPSQLLSVRNSQQSLPNVGVPCPYGKEECHIKVV